MTRSLRVAIVGAGPAGIYAGNILHRQVSDTGGSVAIDLFESLPAPYGLIRYGVAPDHPRIKGIVNSLHEMLDSGDVRLIGNVEIGRDITVPELRERYDAVIFATGALKDAPLDIPGINLPGSYGAADFVAWYDGHPDVPREWPLTASSVAVLGNGNVALDVARVLAKHPLDLLTTDIPANVYAGLQDSPVTDVHVFGRRGPGHIKFTPIELRELGEVPGVDIVLYDEDFEIAATDSAAAELAAANNQMKVMTRTLERWRKPAEWHPTASRRLHLHFFHRPAEVLGTEHVTGIRFERTKPVADGSVVGTGTFIDYDVQAVYRAVGYASSAIAEVPFDVHSAVIPNERGRVVDASGTPLPGVYATGWIKRGPVGLIGHTKGDALETITNLVADSVADLLPIPPVDAEGGTEVLALLDARGIEHTNWQGWLALDAHERALGEGFDGPVTRERIKVVSREEQVDISRSRAGISRGR